MLEIISFVNEGGGQDLGRVDSFIYQTAGFEKADELKANKIYSYDNWTSFWKQFLVCCKLN